MKRNNSPGFQFFGSDGKVYNPWPTYSFSGHLRPWPLVVGLLFHAKTVFRNVPDNIIKPDYAGHPDNIPVSEINHPRGKIVVLNDEEIKKMRKLAREVMDEVAKVIAVGITTEYIDQVVHEACISRSSYPSPLTYYKFPKSVCTSVNEVVCHGIPDSRPLQDGDIINVDITLYHDGFHGDLNETFAVGVIDPLSIKLLTITHECISKAIEIVKPGVAFKEIGELIETHATKFGYSVVRNYTGHGINRLFHCPPTIYHRKNNYKGIMMAGHTFTIEPMLNIGIETVNEWPDDWTVVTRDGKRSAQFEQTLLVTNEGCEVLTARKEFPNRPYFFDQLKNLQSHDMPTN